MSWQAQRYLLLQLAGVSKGEYEAILMQGSGTFSLEAVVSSSVPPDGKLLVIINGAYGRRTEAIAKALKIPTVALNTSEDSQPDLREIETALATDPSITHVAVVHCETTSDVRDLLAAIRKTKTEMGIR